MAVAGVHKASGLDMLFDNKERPTTPTSSIRKMWRDLEKEGRVKENERRETSVIVPESPCSSYFEGKSMESEDALRGANEIENECPQGRNQMVLQEKGDTRKMLNEWGSKSFAGHTVYSSSRLNNECKRMRKCIESSTQQCDPYRTIGSEKSATQIGSRINGAQSSIRRIYGRQALLDLLTKFGRERKREVDNLLENRFVSNFAHRHRIQSLLKGRFLRNQRFVVDEKQTSVAASELGFLRQTHAVSDIRKGFLTKLNNCCHAAQSDSDTSSDNEMNNYDLIEQAGEVVQKMPHEISENLETGNLTNHLESHNPPEFPSAAGIMHGNNILQYEEREKLPFKLDYSPAVNQFDFDTSSDSDMTNEYSEPVVGEQFETNNFTLNPESTNPQECAESDSDSVSDTSSEIDMKFGHIDQAEEIIHEIPNASHDLQKRAQSDSDSNSSSDNDLKFDHIHQAEETVHKIPNVSHSASHDDGGWFQETVGSDFLESHEEEWYDNDNVVNRTESWFGGNSSYLEAALVSRSNTFHWSDDDDDNGSRVAELTELTNRRRVSNLLQSDFGARLDHLMQSYVKRQDQAFESEHKRMQDHDQQQSLDEKANGIDASPQTHGYLDLDYLLSTEQEIIKGLRIDMEALEQRMNDMQKMLEACMDMQYELQRSVRQEIHSALDRSSTSRGAFEDDGVSNYQPKSTPQTGDCFLCCDDGFESLPNRSAQMLHVCSKCAQKVNWSKLKESVRHP
ncbi:hypothetical protein SSX86_023471 [Deinandra increscens subsp. villosa]|uniref:Uncharacterized protein n=1 Tax=Deinandra increscens subsp. villosa TaxID=3103831 RepID=A0AAP0CSR5_9ASTR